MTQAAKIEPSPASASKTRPIDSPRERVVSVAESLDTRVTEGIMLRHEV
jgi:hypothetical protein